MRDVRKYLEDREKYYGIKKLAAQGVSVADILRTLSILRPRYTRLLRESERYELSEEAGIADTLCRAAARQHKRLLRHRSMSEIMFRRCVCKAHKTGESIKSIAERHGYREYHITYMLKYRGRVWEWPPLSAMGYDVSQLSPQERADIGVLGGCY